MLSGETSKITSRRVKYKFRTLCKKNLKLVQCIGTLGGCRFQGCSCKVYDSVGPTEGFGLLLAEGCDHITTLTPLYAKTSSEAFGIHQSDSCLCLNRDMVMKLTQIWFGDDSLLTIV
jgi:hypothetical protein